MSLTVPVNLKDRDAFHLTIEEYLQSLISLIDELVSSSISSSITLLILLSSGTPGCQFSDLRKLRKAPSDQSVYQGCARRLPDSQSEE